jgi:hypothetical protein
MAEKDGPTEPTIHFLLATVYKVQGKILEAQQEMRSFEELKRFASQAEAKQESEANAIKSAAN